MFLATVQLFLYYSFGRKVELLRRSGVQWQSGLAVARPEERAHDTLWPLKPDERSRHAVGTREHSTASLLHRH